MSIQPEFRVGVIGTGRHGSRYANHLVHDVPGLQLAAIARRSPAGEEQAAAWGCQYFTDWRALVRCKDVDGVIAVVPPTMNLDIAVECAQVGKPVLIEKPLAGSLQDAERIVALITQQGLRLTAGQTLRYNAVIQSLKQHVTRVGKLYTFSANQRLEPSTLVWHTDPLQAGAGVSFHTAVHVFDALRFITGLEVSRVVAATLPKGSGHLEDVLAVLVEMNNGVIGTVDCSKVGHARSGLYEFVGERCQLVGEQIRNSCSVIEQQHIIDLSPDEPVSTIVPLLGQWRDYVLDRGENPIPGTEGLAAVRICDACLQAARNGQWVDVEAA